MSLNFPLENDEMMQGVQELDFIQIARRHMTAVCACGTKDYAWKCAYGILIVCVCALTLFCAWAVNAADSQLQVSRALCRD